jgi:Na+-translocating ferredoxin:NAD+ oxidoreductase RnfG subunit
MLKANLLVIIFIAMLIHFATNIYGGELRDKAENIIYNIYNDKIVINVYQLPIKGDLKKRSELFAKQRFWGQIIYFYEIISGDSLIGYAILDNVLGKVKPITFLVIFNTDNSIKSVDIIKYREQYGVAVERREWLDQFSGKSLNSDLKLGSAIDGISGATISVKTIIKGVNRLLYFITNIGEYERNLLVSIE